MLHLQLKTSTQLTLTPQMQMGLRLLQLSSQELELELQKQLSENPLLELVEESPGESSTEEMESVEWDEGSGSTGEESGWTPEATTEAISLLDHLMAQVRLAYLTDEDKAGILTLISLLDERGYLPEEEWNQLLLSGVEEPINGWPNTLSQLQDLDPVGIGARDLAECLLLQLRKHEVENNIVILTRKLVQDHLDLLAKKDYDEIVKQLKCAKGELSQVIELIHQLNPDPGAGFREQSIQGIVPDLIVFKQKGRWQVRLNSEVIPKVGIYSQSASWVAQGGASGLSTQFQEAKWLIKSLNQRFATILRVGQCIVEHQQAFFAQGRRLMRPLVTRLVAEELSLHESTVSRAMAHKYMQTPHGVFELKFFFGRALVNEVGEEASATAIKACIQQLIKEEDPKKPLSDQVITDCLNNQGIKVARRTVTKYREQLHIGSKHLRKPSDFFTEIIS